MRIVFMGTPDFAVPTLEKLMEGGHEIVAVVTAPDRPAGRGRKLQVSPVKAYAEKQGLLVLQPEKLRDAQFNDQLDELEPDLAVVVAFRMLPEMVWSKPRLGSINLHASLLPDYRGAAPINWVLINGEKKTGATTFFIDAKIDTGKILLQREIEIPEEWNAGDLHDALMVMGADLVLETVDLLAADQLKPRAQKSSLVRHEAPKIYPADCHIDWDQKAESIYNFIRGLSPWPGAWTRLEEKQLKVFEAGVGEETNCDPGTLQATDSGELLVATRDRWLVLNQIQLAGKKRMSASDFLRGYQGNLSKLS